MVVAFDVPVYEGTYITSKYIVDTSDVEQRFILGDNRSDTSTLTVRVQTSAVDDTNVTTYTKVTDISQLSTSEVYYLQEVEGGRFEVYFGDDVISKGLSDGNIVILIMSLLMKLCEWCIIIFSAPSSIDGVSSITTTTVTNASGGAEPESMNQ